jgi:hypothetical protein
MAVSAKEIMILSLDEGRNSHQRPLLQALAL